MATSGGELMNSAASERWLSLEEIAQHLGMSKVTIYKWIEAGKIPGHKVGRNWKFKVSEVDAWVVRGDGQQNERPDVGK